LTDRNNKSSEGITGLFDILRRTEKAKKIVWDLAQSSAELGLHMKAVNVIARLITSPRLREPDVFLRGCISLYDDDLPRC